MLYESIKLIHSFQGKSSCITICLHSVKPRLHLHLHQHQCVRLVKIIFIGKINSWANHQAIMVVKTNVHSHDRFMREE
jgi:hypothetical protein